ncbi:uncharacterized protein LOC128678118 isoform X2 [Plodia interpunctella]|uniref:uncharacterized protein LOC128678118 isoform X2 n=1 Tax=Plodia interpunctella TaxID=58824 RepID=UPI00310118ED
MKHQCKLLPISTWEYKIKVEGKLDIGNQISAFLKEIRARVIEQKMRAMGHGQGQGEEGESYHGDKKKGRSRDGDTGNEEMPSIAEMSNKGEEDMTLLDEMIKKGEKRMHLYGSHKSVEEKDRNNVNV